MNRITSADIIDTGDYIIGEKYKIVDFLLSGIYQQLVDYDNEKLKESREKTLENLIYNMENTAKILKNEKVENAKEEAIIKIDYSNDYNMVVNVYEKEN